MAGGVPAAAADVDVVVADSIVITNQSVADPDEPTQRWDAFRIDFDIDTTGKAVAPGDTFSVGLPQIFTANATSFDITATDDPTEVVASCVVTSGNDTTGGGIVCTFEEYVRDHPDLQGSVWFRGQFRQETTSETVEITVNGEIEIVDLPGTGGVGPDDVPPMEEPTKWGWFETSGGRPDVLTWQIFIPGAYYPLGTVTVEDTFNPADTALTAYTYIPGSAGLMYYPDQAAWEAQQGQWIGLGDADAPIQWTFTPTATGFSATVEHTDPDALYRISYRTDLDHPELIQTGMRVGNEATVGEDSVSQTVLRQLQGGGNADGPGTGSFQVIKDPLTGSGAAAVDPALIYIVNATYTFDGAPVTTDIDGVALVTEFELTAGGAAVIQDRLRTGTEVTLTEVVPVDTATLDWQTPELTLYQDDAGTTTTGPTGPTATTLVGGPEASTTCAVVLMMQPMTSPSTSATSVRSSTRSGWPCMATCQR